MCMEDVQLGREADMHATIFAAGTSAAKMITANAKRWALKILPPSSGVIWVMPGTTVVAGQGFVLTAGDSPLSLNVQHDGQMVMYEWWCVADEGAPNVMVIEHWLAKGTRGEVNAHG